MKRSTLISVVVGAALAIVPAAFAAEISDAGGGSVSQAKAVTMAPTSYQDALRTYGSTGSQSSTTTPMSQIDPAIRAVLVRNEPARSFTGTVTDDRGDAAFAGQTDTLGGTTTTTTSSGSSFDVNWSAVAPAIALGLLLIAMTATVVTRRRHQHQLSV